MRAVLMSLGLTTAASLAGCNCTAMGCGGGVDLTLEGAEKYGVYTTSLIAETDAMECAFTLSEAGLETSSECTVSPYLEVP